MTPRCFAKLRICSCPCWEGSKGCRLGVCSLVATERVLQEALMSQARGGVFSRVHLP